MDLFQVKCLKCGHSFGLTDNELYHMTGCSCPKCNQKMGPWQFYAMKEKFFSCALMQKKILATIGFQTPDIRMFSVEVAGDESEPEDVRLLRHLQSLIEQEAQREDDNT